MGMHGKKHSEEAKEKMRKTRKEKIESGEIVIWNIGIKTSDEAKKKQSDAKKGTKLSEATKKKIGDSHRGKKYAKRRGKRIVKDSTRKKLSIANMGKVMPKETNKKISDTLKANAQKPDYVNPRKGKVTPPETKKKQSDAKLKLYENGYVNPFKGKKHKPETIERLRICLVEDLKSGRRIPYCNTKPELEAEQILIKHNLNYISQKCLRDEVNNKIRFFDFYLSDYNILLEIDGCYWHSKDIKDEDITKKALIDVRENDKYKDKLANEQGYNLLRVWEDELDKLDEYCRIMLWYRKKEVS